jgi:hypothetical protein
MIGRLHMGSDPILNPIQALVDVATDKLPHLYEGSCPDRVEGHEVRDINCPACIAIERVTKLWLT